MVKYLKAEDFGGMDWICGQLVSNCGLFYSAGIIDDVPLSTGYVYIS